MSIASPYQNNKADSTKKSNQPAKPVTTDGKGATASAQKSEKPVSVKKDSAQKVTNTVKPVTTATTVTKKDTSKRSTANNMNYPTVIVSKPYVRKDTSKHSTATTATKTVTTGTTVVKKDTAKHSTSKPIGTSTYVVAKPKPVIVSDSNDIEDTLVISSASYQKKASVDTVAVVAKAPESKQIGHFFTSHLLKTQHTNPVSLNREGKDWVFYCLLLIVALFTATRAIHARNIKQMRDAMMSNTISNQIIRDDNILFQRASMFLTVVFYLSISLLLYNSSNYFNWDDTYLSSGFGRFFIFVLLISFIYTIKLSTLKMLGYTLQIEKATNSYIFNVFLINNILGVVLIPVLVGMSFMDPIFYSKLMILALVLVGIAYTYRITRGMLIGAGTGHFSPYYLILYLCTLEIAPLLFFAKLLIK